MFRRIGRLTVMGVMVAVLLGCAASMALHAEEETPVAADQASSGQMPIPIPAFQRSFPQFATTRVDDAVFAVGFQIAQLRMTENSEYLPLVVAMQNFKHKMWSIKQKDFQLYDETGTLIEPISLKEIRREYKRYSKDYQILLQTTTLDQLLPNAEFAGGVRGAKQIPTVDTGKVFYRHTLFYPTPGDTAVYSATLDFKNFFFDLIYYKDIADKWLKMSIPGKKRRPQLDLVFKVSSLKK